MKIIINKCYGGFGISPFGIKKMMERKGKEVFFYKKTEYAFQCGYNEYERIDADEVTPNLPYLISTTEDLGAVTEKIPDTSYFRGIDGDCRTDKDLIAVLEEYGSKAVSSHYSNLCIEEIPSGTMYKINEYDGSESIEYKESDDWSVAV